MFAKCSVLFILAGLLRFIFLKMREILIFSRTRLCVFSFLLCLFVYVVLPIY